MFARVNVLEDPPEQMDEHIRHVREQTLPQFQRQDGFKGLIGLSDRQTGKVLGITLWENEQAVRASEEAANHLRSESAEAGGQTIADVERYEVTLLEVSS
jgi:heme-degrading monooxygenase HmoA